MITSRPQAGPFITLSLLVLISFFLAAINLLSIMHDPQPPWFNYAIVVVLLPIGLFLGWKTVFRFKIIRLGNSQLSVRYPQFGINRTYSLKEIKSWKETVINTGKSSTYKEIEINFSDGRTITMAFKEFTEYNEIFACLKKKVKQ